MGCGKKAYDDDLESWIWFKKNADIEDAKWDVYSDEARFAEQGKRDHKYTGRRLKLHVKHCMEMQELRLKHEKEVQEFKILEELENKFA
jgi:hypothetical protein